MTVSKRDFEAIASALNSELKVIEQNDSIYAKNNGLDIIHHISHRVGFYFAMQNKNFDREKFLNAVFKE